MLYVTSLYHAHVYINDTHHIPTIYANKHTVCQFASAVTNITFVLKLQFERYVAKSNNFANIYNLLRLWLLTTTNLMSLCRSVITHTTFDPNLRNERYVAISTTVEIIFVFIYTKFSYKYIPSTLYI
jgi:hypothetical protein